MFEPEEMMFRNLALSGLALLLCAALAFGQTAAVASTSTAGGGTFSMSTSQFNTPAVTGAPYSAEQVQERVQTLADGTHITQNYSVERMWRDSQGRTRTERSMGSPISPNAQQMPAIVEIRDPAAGAVYILDTQAKVAHRIALQPMQTRTTAAMARPATVTASGQTAPVQAVLTGGASGTLGGSISYSQVSAPMVTAATDPNRRQFSSESLGTQVIEGVMAQGSRTTTVYPVGSQGNDRPITVTSDTWTSPDLRMTVLSKTSDPRSGDNTTKLTNISRIDPDPLLFMPPADYSIVEETGNQVTIHYTIPAR